MTLSTEPSTIPKDPLLVLHGWGMNSAVWEPIVNPLETKFQVTWLDLPGYGQHKTVRAKNLDEIVTWILTHIKAPTHIMGWSLGGLLLQALIQQHPQRIKRVIMVTTTPCFSQQEQWKNAMPQAILNQFANNLTNNCETTIKRFITLQFLGVKGTKRLQNNLIHHILKTLPDKKALNTGLTLLKTKDYRKLVIPHQQLWILGGKDRLIPIKLHKDLSFLHPEATIKIISEAGHLPFITHPQQFMVIIQQFFDVNMSSKLKR
ncbi:MAG: pimeloyl-ACP methyl ester esterase BioH [Cocleimonas sp.]|nr:pimeloyl-ACP methyl ester esterase BioH [Cocleimonas sp.]